MARGNSGRIVIEIDPCTKSALYKHLALQDLTLKDWFLNNVERYIEDQLQPQLFSASLNVDPPEAIDDD